MKQFYITIAIFIDLNIIVKDYFIQILHSIRNLIESNFQKLLVVLEKHVYSTCVFERKWVCIREKGQFRVRHVKRS